MGKGKAHVWQFHDDSGWVDFDPSASMQLEKIWQDRQAEGEDDTNSKVSLRSGSWAYAVDFDTMTQTNEEHSDHKARSIRRTSMEQSHPQS